MRVNEWFSALNRGNESRRSVQYIGGVENSVYSVNRVHLEWYNRRSQALRPTTDSTMDWIIHDELGLTVRHVVSYAAASAMVIGGIIPYIPQ